MSYPKQGAAKPTGRIRTLHLSGMLLVCHAGTLTPILIQIPSDPEDLFIPVFSGKKELDECRLPFDGRIVQIEDGVGFMASIPPSHEGRRIRVVADVRILDTPEGPMTRFCEILRENSTIQLDPTAGQKILLN